QSRTLPFVRTSLAAVALAIVVACGRSDRRATRAATPGDHSTAPTTSVTPPGPDPIILRAPRVGAGPLRAYAYSALDTAIWTSVDKAPAIARVLAFDDDAGSVAVVDGRGALRRFDLRAGAVTPPPQVKLTGLSTYDGQSIYGINAKGDVARLTRTDETPWLLTPPGGARDVAPRPDGSIIVVGSRKGSTVLWHVRPPESRLLDSAVLPPPAADRVVRTQLGDRVYLVADSSIEGVRGRDLVAVAPITFPRRIRAVAATPSGDRIYVALDSTTTLQVIDRYSDRLTTGAELPGAAIDMRMDPLGRYILVRPLAGDSAWILAVGTDHVSATVHTAWTTDLPFVGPDGQVATSVKNDVVFVDATTGVKKRVVPGGAKDFWIPIRWNGFRPRPASLDAPVTFNGVQRDTTDTIGKVIENSKHDSTLNPSASHAIVDTAHGNIGRGGPEYVVQFAAVLSADAARSVASSLGGSGRNPRVIESKQQGRTIYKVVMGPFSTQEQAEAAGRAANRQYWVYQGTP
ncbi:MAG TPA: SPOR domain-containing protein, partial [Gemmatimonadaceae bacterium]|nr:SPOR domain-containing protein [Gemmatimonadaceae bacterium]